ncbi:hypothetical protein [Pseudomonas haemolytica]|jgi:hypothetical protein|uniref:DUF4238 domain-containing protein n=1 Tax=Pseudomonas haemolytica TaxID=2600065 RepID=A0ABS1H0E1_9PSED|nr:hypothetical protein [Pseudomonas haemolytica]MBK3462674.1 hypothetical protein [Pseudomonas haemolytica]
MNTTSQPKTHTVLLEEMLEQDIKTLVEATDKYLTANPHGTAFIPKPLLNVFESHSSLAGKDRYKKSTSKFIYVSPWQKAPQSKNDYLTGYKQNPLIFHLLLAVAYHGYQYTHHNLLSVLPKIVNSSIFNLASWGVRTMNTTKSNLRALSSINTVFSLVTVGTELDYLKHIMNKFSVDLNDTVINKVTTIKTDSGLGITFVISDAHCMALIDGNVYVAKVADELELCVGDLEFLMTPEGVVVEEMKYIKNSITSFDFKQEVKQTLASKPTFKTKKNTLK